MLKKDLLSQGILPSQIDNENYFEITTVLAARKRDDRPDLVDPLEVVMKMRKGGK